MQMASRLAMNAIITVTKTPCHQNGVIKLFNRQAVRHQQVQYTRLLTHVTNTEL